MRLPTVTHAIVMANGELSKRLAAVSQRPWSQPDVADERWRPRVVRTAGSVAEAVYGLILATSVIAVSREYDSSNAGRIGVTVLVTAVVFWLAHVYARGLAESLRHHRMAQPI